MNRDVTHPGVELRGGSHASRGGVDRAMLDGETGQRPGTLGRHSDVAVDHEASPDNYRPVEYADSLGILIGVGEIPHDAVLDGGT